MTSYPNRSTLFWLTVLTFSIVEFLATLGVRTLLRIGDLLAAYEWLPISLTLTANLSPIPTTVVDVLALPLVFVLCFVTVVTYSRGTDYRAATLSKPLVASSTGSLFGLYCIFVIPWGGLDALIASVPRAVRLDAYLNLVALAFAFGVVIPFQMGLHSNPDDSTGHSRRKTGVLTGTAYLFAGGLAILASIDWVIALLTVGVSLYQLRGSSKWPRIAPETNLISSLSLIVRNSLGFAIVYCIVTGLVLTAELFGVATGNSVTVISPLSWDIYPRLTLLTLGVSLVTLIAAGSLLISLPRIPHLGRAGPPIALLLVVVLWAVSVGLTVVSSFFGFERTLLSIENPYVYPTVLATGVVAVEWVRYKTRTLRWYLVAVLGFLILVGSQIWNNQLNLQLIFLELALIGYWGGPLFEWCGRLINERVVE